MPPLPLNQDGSINYDQLAQDEAESQRQQAAANAKSSSSGKSKDSGSASSDSSDVDAEIDKKIKTLQDALAEASGFKREELAQQLQVAIADRDARTKAAQISADASKYGADQGLAGTKYASDNSKQASMYGSDQSLKATQYSSDNSKQASMYGADQGLAGTKYASDNSLSGTKYASDNSLAGTKYGADSSLAGTKYASDNSLAGTKYSSDASLKGSMYGADQGLRGQLYSADTSAGNTQYTTDADLYKFNATQPLERAKLAQTFLTNYAQMAGQPSNFLQAADYARLGMQSEGMPGFVTDLLGQVNPYATSGNSGFVTHDTSQLPGNAAVAAFGTNPLGLVGTRAAAPDMPVYQKAMLQNVGTSAPVVGPSPSPAPTPAPAPAAAQGPNDTVPGTQLHDALWNGAFGSDGARQASFESHYQASLAAGASHVQAAHDAMATVGGDADQFMLSIGQHPITQDPNTWTTGSNAHGQGVTPPAPAARANDMLYGGGSSSFNESLGAYAPAAAGLSSASGRASDAMGASPASYANEGAAQYAQPANYAQYAGPDSGYNTASLSSNYGTSAGQGYGTTSQGAARPASSAALGSSAATPSILQGTLGPSVAQTDQFRAGVKQAIGNGPQQWGNQSLEKMTQTERDLLASGFKDAGLVPQDMFDAYARSRIGNDTAGRAA